MTTGIEVTALDEQGNRLDVRLFDTVDAARDWVDYAFPAAAEVRLDEMTPDYCGRPIDVRVGIRWYGREIAEGLAADRIAAAKERVLARWSEARS